MTYRWYAMVLVAGYVISAASVCAGPPFKTDDPEPVDYRHWEFYLASEQEYGGDETNSTCPHIEVNYGVLPDVQLHIVAPMGYVHNSGGTHYGYSNTELGVKYRFVNETGTMPQIGVFPLVELPTGSKGNELGTGNTQVYFPVWLQKSEGSLTSYAGAGFWYNPGEGQKNWLFTGWEVQYDLSETVTLGEELYYQTADSPDADAETGFNVGGFINFNEHNHLLFSIGRTFASLTSAYFAYQLTI